MTTASPITTLLTGVQDQLSSGITDALPLAGTIFATVAGIFIAVKIFKRITGAKN